MIDLIICGMNLSCHFKNLNSQINGPKYPEDVEQVCYFFEKRGESPPEYCNLKVETPPIRKRHEF